MRFQMNKAKTERDEAEKEHREYKAKTRMDLEMKDQVRDGTSVTSINKLIFFLKLVDFYAYIIHLYSIIHN